MDLRDTIRTDGKKQLVSGEKNNLQSPAKDLVFYEIGKVIRYDNEKSQKCDI